MFPIIPILTSIPSIITSIKGLYSIKNKAIEADTAFQLPEEVSDEIRKKVNENKHGFVLRFVKSYFLPHMRLHGIKEDDIEVIIKFVVLIKNKGKGLVKGFKSALKSGVNGLRGK